MGNSTNVSEVTSSEKRIRALEDTIAYMQRDYDSLVKKLEAVMTDTARTKRRVETWPFITVAV